jgi:adenosine deaminase
MSGLTEADIQRIPKLELHIHLEGTFDLETICCLAEKHGVPLPRPRESLISFTGLADFLELLDWICSLVRDQADVRLLARRFAAYAREQGIVYAEVIVNPSHWKNIPMETLLSGVLEGFEEAGQAGLPDCRLLVSLRREQSDDSARQTVEWVLAHRHPRLLGLSMDGDERLAQDSNRRFGPLLRQARAAGLGVTIHAGESSGPEGVIAALDEADACRIDHGVRAIEDPALLERLRLEQIALNVCLTSNVLGGLYTEQTHPLKQLYDSGIPVTLSTDDPKLLNVTLCQELANAAALYGWTEADIIRLQEHAVAAAFCTLEEKERLTKMLRADPTLQ